jgi:hypothetical protein
VADIDPGNVTKMLQVAATNVKKGWAERLKGSAYASGAPSSISYDLHGTTGARLGALSAEIGPELKGQGPIAGLIEMGSPGRNLAPHGFGLAALHDEEPDFETGVGKVVDSALKKANL